MVTVTCQQKTSTSLQRQLPTSDMSPNSSQKLSAEVRAEIKEVLKRQEEEEKERKKRQEELARQLVELKVAEKAVEEADTQWKRAEETVRLQGVSGSSEEDRMDVDAAAEGNKGKEKAKKDEEDGEDGEGVRLELVSGKNRCRTCVRDDAECRINSDAITRWRENVEGVKSRLGHQPAPLARGRSLLSPRCSARIPHRLHGMR